MSYFDYARDVMRTLATQVKTAETEQKTVFEAPYTTGVILAKRDDDQAMDHGTHAVYSTVPEEGVSPEASATERLDGTMNFVGSLLFLATQRAEAATPDVDTETQILLNMEDRGVILSAVKGKSDEIPFRTIFNEIDRLEALALGGWQDHAYDSDAKVKDVDPEAAEQIRVLVTNYAAATGATRFLDEETIKYDKDTGEITINTSMLAHMRKHEPFIDGTNQVGGYMAEQQTVRVALRDAMAEEMRRDKDVFVMGEEVAEYQGAYKVTEGLLAEFGDDRVIDTPITEHGFAGLGVGAAMTGLRPIVEFMTWNFAMQAIDQIINSAAKTNYMSGGQVNCPIVFRGPNGAAARVAAQHSQCYASWYAHVPGLIVIAPYDSASAKGLLKAAIRDPNPVIFLENEILYGQKYDMPDEDDFVLPIGKAEVLREGKDVTITAYSIQVGDALTAAEKLAEEGIDAEVVDLRTIRPLDKDAIIDSVKKTHRIVSVEEGWPYAGIGSEIAAVIMEDAFDELDAPVLRVTGKDVPLPYAENLEKMALPQVDDIVEAVRELF